MGNFYSTIPIEYGIFIGEDKKGQTRILRNPMIGLKPLKEVNRFGVETIWDAFENSVKKLNRSECDCLGTRKQISSDKYGEYQWKTYKQVYDESISFSRGIANLNLITINDSINNLRFLGICSKNREEWIIADLACHINSITVIPINHSLDILSISYILNQTNLSTLVIESKYLTLFVALSKLNLLFKLNSFILLNEISYDNESIKHLTSQGINFYYYDKIIKVGQGTGKVDLISSTPDTICTIIYSIDESGTLRGSIISHKTLMICCDILVSKGIEFGNDDVYFSFLSLFHIMEKLIVIAFLTHGNQVGFYSRSSRRLFKDAELLHPTCLSGVPIVFEKIRDKINETIEAFEPMQKYVYSQAIEMKLNDYHTKGIITNILLDYSLFKRIKDILGGRVRLMFSVLVNTNPILLTFIKVCLSCFIIEGYGQPEAIGLLFNHLNDKVNGHFGGPGLSNEIKLIDKPELGYYSTYINPSTKANEPRGEICVRGYGCFSGYYLNPNMTMKAFSDDGWLHTGMIGQIKTQHGNAIEIIDSLNDFIASSKGLLISRSKITKILLQSPYINHIYIDIREETSLLEAIISPNEDACLKYLQKVVVDLKEPVNIYSNKTLKEEILQNCRKLSKTNYLSNCEMINKIYLVSQPFTESNGLLKLDNTVNKHKAKLLLFKQKGTNQ